MSGLTPKLKELVDRAREWPADAQDALAEVGTSIEAIRSGTYHPSSAELSAVDEGLDQLERGEYASPERIARALASLGRHA